MIKETLETTNKLIIPTTGKDIKSQEIFESLESISSEELIEAGKEIETKIIEKEREEAKRKEEEKIEKLKGNTYAILKDLKENHVKVEEDAEMMGYKGKKVHIDLPAVGNFEGFKFKYFVSDRYISKRKFEKKKLFESQSELEKASYSMKEISELLHAMNKYMIELQGNNDGNMDYENELKDWKRKTYVSCKAGEYIKNITGLIPSSYWMSDNRILYRKTRVVYYFSDECWHSKFSLEDDNGSAIDAYGSRLLLRLSD